MKKTILKALRPNTPAVKSYVLAMEGKKDNNKIEKTSPEKVKNFYTEEELIERATKACLDYQNKLFSYAENNKKDKSFPPVE